MSLDKVEGEHAAIETLLSHVSVKTREAVRKDLLTTFVRMVESHKKGVEEIDQLLRLQDEDLGSW